MYKPRDHYRHGAQIDPVAELELRRWAFKDAAEDAALLAYEGMAEFGPGCRTEERCEREYTRMESEVDYHEQILHPSSEPEWA
jgi:hypothetical protein